MYAVAWNGSYFRNITDCIPLFLVIPIGVDRTVLLKRGQESQTFMRERNNFASILYNRTSRYDG